MNVPSADSRRRYRSRSEVQDLVRQFHQSGLSTKEFAACMGVHPTSVRRWIRISASQASVPDSKPRFLPIQLRPPDVASPHGWSVEIIHPAGPMGRSGAPPAGWAARDGSCHAGTIRPTVAGKWSGLFIGYPEAGWRSAVIDRLLITTRRCGLDPAQWLEGRAPEDPDVDDGGPARAAAGQWEAHDGVTSPGPGRGSRPTHAASTPTAGNPVLHRMLTALRP